jgi:NTE family protein
MNTMISAALRLSSVVLITVIAGCASSSHISNAEISEAKSVDFPLQSTNRPGQRSDETLFFVAFSGGGTRAAAFSYGVLEKLRDTAYTKNGAKVRLLDEIDVISSVSGGSFTAAYFGLFGDRIFEDYEGVFLRRNVQKTLVGSLFNPVNWIRAVFTGLNRTEMAIDYYDRNIFEGSTFSDIKERGGPRIEINATDLSIGERFAFNQEQFNLLCSDLGSFSVARAVAASSAVPVAFKPVSLKNHSGCNYSDSPHIQAARRHAEENPRFAIVLENLDSYLDKESRQYIHLVDGGITDNLGIRTLYNRLETAGVTVGTEHEIVNPPRYIVAVIVDADTSRENSIDTSEKPLSNLEVVSAVTNTQIDRYSAESLSLLEVSLRDWAARLSTPQKPVTPFFITLDFEDLPSENARKLFNNMATSFSLPDNEVDSLIEAGNSLLENSAEFQAFVTAINQDER